MFPLVSSEPAPSCLWIRDSAARVPKGKNGIAKGKQTAGFVPLSPQLPLSRCRRDFPLFLFEVAFEHFHTRRASPCLRSSAPSPPRPSRPPAPAPAPAAH